MELQYLYARLALVNPGIHMAQSQDMQKPEPLAENDIQPIAFAVLGQVDLSGRGYFISTLRSPTAPRQLQPGSVSERIEFNSLVSSNSLD